MPPPSPRTSWIALALALVACDGGCPADTFACSEGCVDLASDRANCGACGQRCAVGQSCALGRCGCDGDGETLCGGACLRTDADPSNCGACGAVCPEGAACVGGACACPDGLTACAGACVSTDDDANCGGCGVACSADQTCVEGACACASSALALCDGHCVDLADDPRHCGVCGSTCVDPRVCGSGACACPSGLTSCGARCLDLERDPSSCGECGFTCDGGACDAGRCVPTYLWHATRPSGGYMLTGFPEWDGRVALADDGTVYLGWSEPEGDVHLLALTPTGEERWARTVGTNAVRVGDVVALDDGGMALLFQYEPVAGIDALRVVAYEADGTSRWTRAIGTTGNYAEAGSLAARAGLLAVSGAFNGELIHGAERLMGGGFRDAFVALLDPTSGEYVDVGVWGGRGTEEGVHVAFASDGDLLVAGYSGAGIDFGGGATGSTLGGFLARLAPDLSHRWSRRVLADALHGVAAAPSGDVLVTGRIGRSTDWGGGASFDVRTGDEATFLLAVDHASGESRWADGLEQAYVDPARGPVVDDEGRPFYGASGGATGMSGGHQATLLGYRPGTMFPFYQQTFGSPGSDFATGIATSGRRLAFAGRFGGPMTLGGVTETPDDLDVFVVVFSL